MTTPLRMLRFDSQAYFNRNDVELLDYLTEKMWDVEDRDDDCKDFHNSLYELYHGYLHDDLLRLGASYLSVCDLMDLRELVNKIKTN